MARRVLVVDDHPMSLELVTEILRQEGHQVLAAACGDVGLRLTAAERPDLIVMDVHLPDMSGYEAIRRLKTDPATATIPVVVVTASAMRGEDCKAREIGADGYLAKPLNARAFRETLRRLLAEGGRQ